MIRRASWVLLLSLLLAPLGPTALAAPPPPPPGNAKADARSQAKAQVRKGQLDYKLARFEQALQDYTHAYELFPVPALLFNLGQCHRNLKNYERAIFFFEGFLREQAKISQDQRALTEALIAECQAAQDQQNARQNARQNTDAAAAAARFAAPPVAATTASSTRLRAAALRTGGLRAPGAAAQVESSSHPHLMGDGDAPAQTTPVTHRWWFWTAIAGVLAAGAVAYYVSGDPRVVAPTGTVGTVNGRWR